MIITLIVWGVVLIALIAVVVGIVDAAQAPAWRRVAAERREQWRTRQLEFHGNADSSGDPGAWDED